jgi:hypothetical protein
MLHPCQVYAAFVIYVAVVAAIVVLLLQIAPPLRLVLEPRVVVRHERKQGNNNVLTNFGKEPGKNENPQEARIPTIHVKRKGGDSFFRC